MSSRPKELRYETYIAASPERVWKALTDGQMTKRYFYGTEIRGPFKKDGPVVYVGEGGKPSLEGTLLDFQPGKLLAMTCRALWDPAASNDPPSRIVWEIGAAGEATKLSLVHHDIQGGDATVAQWAEGWPVVLSSMKTYLETGKTLKLQ